ncbi:MAG: SRPBCC family protein [Bacteroidota bacterium]|nr:SRPBCC family protein [Bacteroidota bacterium]
MKKWVISIVVGTILFLVFLYYYEDRKFSAYIQQNLGHHSSEMNLSVNQEAPVVSNGKILIDAPVETVWTILSTIDEWPSWQSEVTEARILGDLEVDQAFLWKASGLSFKSTLHTVEPERRIGWTGKTTGAYAVHNWTLSRDGNQTLVVVEESLQGFFPRIFPGYFQKNLNGGIQNNLQELKKACEP